MSLNGAVTLDDISDMDFCTFDDVLKITLQIDAARRLADLRVANHAAQGGEEDIKTLSRDLMKTAYPEKASGPESTRPNQGIGGLKKFLGNKASVRGKR